jgi:diaminohydroxyphosphoribosylaminopyrimidine deaminase/5-amino-6-(5-phosphoribosylamino)uracil reductase
VVIDTEHHLSPTYHVFDGSVPTLLFVNQLYPNFTPVIEQILLPAQNCMQFVMDTLYQKQIQSIIIEGGRYLLQSLIDEHLWDEARVLIGDKTFGNGLEAPKIDQTPDSSTAVEGDFINIFTHKNF